MFTDILRQLALFVLALFFVFLGCLAILVPWSSSVRDLIAHVLLEGRITLFIFGVIFVAVGCWLVGYLLKASRRRRYYIKAGSVSVSIDEKVIDKYLQVYLKERMPGVHVRSRAELRDDHRLHIGLRLPPVPSDKQRSLVEEIEGEVRDLLARVCGYHKPFHLTATFED